MSKNLNLKERREQLDAEYTPTGSRLILDEELAVIIDALAVALNVINNYMAFDEASKLVGEQRQKFIESFKNGKK